VGETGAKPLAGRRVVVTRAAEQCQPVIEALREAGAEAVLLPLVAFAAVENPDELDECLKDAERFDWVFFTSQNAVRALQERAGKIGILLGQSFSGAKIAAVGPATAEVVRVAGLNVDCVSKVHNGVALAEELAGEVRGKNVFLPRSDRANPDLVMALQRHGAIVKTVVAYKTVAPDLEAGTAEEILAKGGVDAVLFFSPSAVHHLRGILGAARFRELGERAAFVAIGPVSENALREERVDRILVAADTTVAATIATLAEFFAKAGQAQPAGAKQR
jgi:uroporphyrinogen-III synthase